MESPYRPSPNNHETVAFGYPGTYLEPDVIRYVNEIVGENLNSIGTHTLPSDGEDGFEQLHQMERENIAWTGNLIYRINPTKTLEVVDGYFCGGGTEGNFVGLWIGRNKLWGVPQQQKKICVIVTKSVIHYSITKSLDILNLKDNIIWVDYNNSFEMDLVDFRQKLEREYILGANNFIVVATVGTTVFGSSDNITELSNIIQEMKKKYEHINIYLHVDASFGGFTVPVLDDAPYIGFENEAVDSIVIDAHKMGHMPYPSGIFLTRKRNQKHIIIDAEYVKGQECTFSGSRSSIAPYAFNRYIHEHGLREHIQYVQTCIDIRNRLVGLLKNLSYVKIVSCPNFVNLLALQINIDGNHIPSQEFMRQHNLNLLYRYLHPSSIFFEYNDTCVYKIYIMPHTFPQIEMFVNDIQNAYKAWNSSH